MIYLDIENGSSEEKALAERAFYFALEKLMPRKKESLGHIIIC